MPLLQVLYQIDIENLIIVSVLGLLLMFEVLFCFKPVIIVTIRHWWDPDLIKKYRSDPELKKSLNSDARFVSILIIATLSIFIVLFIIALTQN